MGFTPFSMGRMLIRINTAYGMPKTYEAQEHSFHHGRSNGRADASVLRIFPDQVTQPEPPRRAGRGVRRRLLQQPAVCTVAFYLGQRAVAEQDRRLRQRGGFSR